MPSPAVEELLQHATALRRLARDLVGETAADDVLQDAAVQALTAPPRHPGPAVGWLATVVRRLAGKHRRAERVRATHEAIAPMAAMVAPPADLAAATADTLRALTDLVTTLPEPYRSTLFARYLREHTPAQIAAESDLPVRTVKTRLQRGLALLRERLGAHDEDWRGALVAAFGLPATTAVVTTTFGILLMTTTMKWLLGALLLAGVFTLAWPWLVAAPPPAVQSTAEAGPAVIAQEPKAPFPRPQPVAPERVQATPAAPATPPVPTAPLAKPDEIVVVAIDAATNQPIANFGLRATMAKRPLLPPGVPLLFGGEHTAGRLLVPEAEFAERLFLLEAEAPYLPSRWFGLGDAVLLGAERAIEVRVGAPIEVDVEVVREGGGAPVVGTVVELLRPWPKSPEVTLRTNATLATAMSVQPDEPELGMKMFGGRALLLGSATTDAAGRAALRVPPDEDFALRLVGPGHRPMVVQPWRIAAAGPREIVVAVSSGGSIRGRVGPPAALAALSVAGPQLANGQSAPPPRSEAGLQFRHVATGEMIPVAQFPRRGVVSIAADGSYAVDGLKPGDWQMTFVGLYRAQETTAAPPAKPHALEPDPRGMTLIELPVVAGVGDLEPRLVDVDLAPFVPGRLDASVQRDGVMLGTGQLSLSTVGACGTPKPPQGGSMPNLLLQTGSRLVATLPPARYVATLNTETKQGWTSLLLGEFDIHAGAETRIDFAVEVVAAILRIVEADGTTPAVGRVQLQKDGQPRGWYAQQKVDGAGEATFTELTRGVVLRATFTRAAAPPPPGAMPSKVEAIDLGIVPSGTSAPVVLRLPAK